VFTQYSLSKEDKDSLHSYLPLPFYEGPAFVEATKLLFKPLIKSAYRDKRYCPFPAGILQHELKLPEDGDVILFDMPSST
jgi:hypothetical protein